ncbi:hsp90 co-chaperone Cdc37 [Dinochytrium kinnereticum]|nr:hsp90 co-chaperone Cdc37 [Dinochytrium kinnereticum]
MPQGFSYSKWDKLELSDDEDFEASMVRWKQADLHRKRRDRKDKIEALIMETDLNNKLQDRLTKFTRDIKSQGAPASDLIAALTAELLEWDNKIKHDVMVIAHTDRDSRWQPPTPDPFFMNRLPIEVLATGLKLAAESGDGSKAADIVSNILQKLPERQASVAAEIKKEEDEINSKITTETIREGFNKTIVTKQATPMTQAPTAIEKPKKTVTTTTKELITLNNPPPLTDPTANAAAASAEQSPATDQNQAPSKSKAEKEEKYITDANVEAFARLSGFDESLKHLGSFPYIVSSKFSDEILAEAFHLEMEGKKKEAKRCVHQSLVLQYCDVLGKDGIRLFFARMANPTHTAREVFQKDVSDTYQRISDRVKVLKVEEKQKEEEERRLAEEEKKMGEARVAAALQPDGTYKLPVTKDSTELEKKRAEVFAEFPTAFQRALLTQDVDEINEVLTSWDRSEAGDLLKRADEVGLITLQEDDGEDDEE